MSSMFGRAVIVPKTNKSGGALAKGDVVIVDTANDNAVTTTTSAGSTVTVGVVVEENGIANNATGRVQFGGHCALITPNASVTRGHYALTHTVAKQCADGGASRVVGAFGIFTTGGTTPEIDLFTQPDGSSASGNVATDPIWDASGDLVQGTGANTAAKLTMGATGTVPTAGASSLAYAFPPGYEHNYTEITGGTTSITATSEGTANTIVTASAGVAFDGVRKAVIEFFAPQARPDATAANKTLDFVLYDDTGGGAGSIGRWDAWNNPAATSDVKAVYLRRRLIPSNATHTYSVRAYVNSGTGAIVAGAGGSGAVMPAFIRVTEG